MNLETNKVLITGASGLIGSYVAPYMSEFKVLAPSHRELDITNSQEVMRYVTTNQPSTIIHLAADRNATAAETQREDRDGSVWQTNVKGVENIVSASLMVNAHVVFFSSNYIFAGGADHPYSYKESEMPDPDNNISWYGITKKAAEESVLTSSSSAAIVRISNPALSLALKEDDYVGKLKMLIENGYPLFINQEVSLTYGSSLVQGLLGIVRGKLRGTFHISTSDSSTPHNIGKVLLEQSNTSAQIKPSDINSYLKQHPLRYPQYGALDSTHTQQRLGYTFPAISEVLYNLVNESKETIKEKN